MTLTDKSQDAENCQDRDKYGRCGLVLRDESDGAEYCLTRLTFHLCGYDYSVPEEVIIPEDAFWGQD